MNIRGTLLSGCVWLITSVNAIPAVGAESPAGGATPKTNAVSSLAVLRASGIRVNSSLACALNEGDGIVIAIAPAEFPFASGTKTRQAIDTLWKLIDKPGCLTITAVLTSSSTDILKCYKRDFVLLMNAESIECLQVQNVPYAFRNRARAGHTSAFDSQGRLVHGPGWIVDTYHNTVLDAQAASKRAADQAAKKAR